MLQLIYFTYSVACVASVSARVRRESWDESKKKRNDVGGGGDGGGGGGGGGGGARRKRLPANL